MLTAVDVQQAPKRAEVRQLKSLHDKKEKQKNKEQKGLDIVEGFLETIEHKSVEKQKPGLAVLQSKSATGTSRPNFVGVAKRQIREKIDRFYDKMPLKPMDEKFKEEHHQKMLRLHKEKINAKLRQLEKQTTFRSEVELKENQLNAARREHDIICSNIQTAKKKLDDYQQMKKRMEGFDNETPEFAQLEQYKLELEQIEEQWVTSDFVKDQLKNMFDRYKADILTLQKNCQTVKEGIRIAKRFREKNIKAYNNRRKQTDRYLNKLKELDPANTHQDKSVYEHDPEVVNEMSEFHGRTILQHIEEREKMLEEEERERLEKIRVENELRKEAGSNKEYDDERKRYKRLEEECREKRAEIEKIVKRMGIADFKLILSTYRELRDNRANIKSIVKDYKEQVEATEREIELLKEDYLKLKFEEEHQSEPQTDLAAGQLDDYDADAVEKLELEYMESNKQLFAKEMDMKRISTLVRNSCTTVSRIMYQLSRNKLKNVEIGQEGLVEALSRVSMHLEKMLGYVHTKNKAIRDENILMRSVYNKHAGNIDLFTPPKFLGLNTLVLEKKESSDDEEQGTFRKNPNTNSNEPNNNSF